MSESWNSATSAPPAKLQYTTEAKLQYTTEAKLEYTTDQLNSTALKWGDDGELSDLDLQRILKLLSQADPVAEALLSASEDPNI